MQMEQGNNLLRVKVSNQSAILRMIYYMGPIKRAEIAKRLELTLPTITTNVNNMIMDGVVREVLALGSEHTGYGRKARLVEIVPEARHFIGVEITGTRRSISIEDFVGHELHSYTDSVVCSDYDKNMEEVCEIISRQLDRCHLTWEHIFGVCFGFPGVVDREEGMLKVHPRNQWNNKNVREDFRRLTGFQGDVTIENNAGVRALGAQLFRRNELWNVQSFVYLFVDTGIACPLIVESSGYTGSVVGSGELGHMVMEPDGLECSCGNHGCLEAYSSDQAVVKRCMKALEKGGAPELQKLCTGSDSVPSMQQIMLAQNRGDPDVTAIVEDAIRMLAVAVSNIINFASPESVLIDCKLFWNEQNRQKLLDTARQNLCNKTYQGTKTIFVEPDPASGARGAAAVAINQNLG